jgi:hypothetical protein
MNSCYLFRWDQWYGCDNTGCPFHIAPEHIFLCDKAPMLRNMIKGSLCIIFVQIHVCMPETIKNEQGIWFYKIMDNLFCLYVPQSHWLIYIRDAHFMQPRSLSTLSRRMRVHWTVSITWKIRHATSDRPCKKRSSLKLQCSPNPWET